MHQHFLMTILLLLSACSEMEVSQVRDGPHVLKQPEQWQALWVCDGLVKSYTFPPLTQTKNIEKCGLHAQLNAQSAKRPAVNYPATEKLAVFSDIHGQFNLMKQLLVANKIIDIDGHWSFSNGHLVVVGDVFDRGDKVTESLWLLYQLQQQATAAGGQVHYLMGNHEVMILNGNLRYLNDKYQMVEDLLGKSTSQLYGQDTVLGQWLQTRNVLVKIGNLLFTHGGLNPELAIQRHSLDEINQLFSENLIEQSNRPREGFVKYLHKSDGPVWYRGYFRPPKATSEEIDLLKSTYEVEHIIVGHTTQDQITSLYDNAVIAVDSGIKNGQNGEVLLIDKGSFYRGLLDGSRIDLE